MSELKRARGDPKASALRFPVVGVGASAGGLEALTQLVSHLPVDGGMAYILVQHLDPSHKSLMGELLAEHTDMPVVQAAEGLVVERNHIYVIPEGVYLSVADGALHLSEPAEAHGARLPIDFLFASMADDLGKRAVGIILSGTGSDGTEGLAALRKAGGFVIVQEPDEAEYDGMPQSAVASGLADAVLPIAKMPAALAAFAKGLRPAPSHVPTPNDEPALAKIIELLRANTAHDFTLYKIGTLHRRIERRMAIASPPLTDMGAYLAVLEKDADELAVLATDLLINVTAFFRDTKVFELLEKSIIPDIINAHEDGQPLRIWIAGCSTGEETYSLAILFTEAIAAVGRPIKLCVFASDVDPDAVAKAREGHYPDSIADVVSPDRLKRFFVKAEHGYTIAPDLRANVVFTIQDLLADPPFSKLDFVSCRNVLIYLGPEAQAKVIALFHFALKKDGILLLGTSETVGHGDHLFVPVAKSERMYRQIGQSRSSPLVFATSAGDNLRVPPRAEQGSETARHSALADLCRRLVLDNLAPAAVLINRRHECLYSVGPTEHYLRVPQGYPTHDVLAMATPGLRARLREAVEQVTEKAPHVRNMGGHVKRDGQSVPFDIDVRLVMHKQEELLLIGFIDAPAERRKSKAPTKSEDNARVAELEQDLATARADLTVAIRDLEAAHDDHRAVNEEALSINEEYQSANEELLTSKEELQSLNEELTALNGQLQETLERQRTTSNDLQNVLYSTEVATLFLDAELKIRFFTPATKSLFNLIPSDVGRPLSDLHALSVDPMLAEDARGVLYDSHSSDCEVAAPGGIWYLRRILPYRTNANGVEGVVITFTDVTERKNARKALELAKREADIANLAKSRFLAAASHDLRQPLQSLALLQGLLVAKVKDEAVLGLLARLEGTLTTMSGMLNTMLDINQIEAGVVRAERVEFVIGDLIDRVRGEFVEQAQAQRLDLRSVRSTRLIFSDPVMIEQMLRNLVSNALKYTRRGKILIGCRLHGDVLRVEVWDTGVGIAASQLDAIFDEYHQIDNAARERSLGLGLGLSIVQRLGTLLGHKVGVRSLPSRGSVFSIDIALPKRANLSAKPAAPADAPLVPLPTLATNKTVLIVDDDPDLRELLEELLSEEGFHTATAASGLAALNLGVAYSLAPDILLADYNLPGGMTGLELAVEMRKAMGADFPVVILTGDIGTNTLRAVAEGDCVQLNKPVRRDTLLAAMHRLLSPTPCLQLAADGEHFSCGYTRDHPNPCAQFAADGKGQTIYIVDDDADVRRNLRELLEADGRCVADYADCEAFLAAYQDGGEACLLIDAHLPGMDGIGLIRALKAAGHHLPAIMITGHSGVPMAVEAMKVGVLDFLEKPVNADALFASVARALDLSRDATKLQEWQADAAARLHSLTPRQYDIMERVLAGHPSKNIAADLNISQRTVESHRAAIMKKTGAKSIPALARLALAKGYGSTLLR